ncbi:hypothetical protein QYE88_42425, partial [Enterobacter hormaechei subsp. steigerwaltii]|nr:hypothetical protein [Enterobacter hormaechei subsp. steigerwaltii]
GAAGVSDGGTGATNAADARSNLGLGSSATKDVGTAAGNVMQVGAFGLLFVGFAARLASLH